MSSLTKLRSNIKAVMERDGVSQSALADRTGLSRPLLSNYLRGETSPGIDAIDRIAAALGVSVAHLFEAGSTPAAALRPPTDPEMLAFVLDKFERSDRIAAARAILLADEVELATMLDALAIFIPGGIKKNKRTSGAG